MSAIFWWLHRKSAALRLPSDISGITPAFYDSQKANRAAAVSESLYEFKRTIRDLGPRAQRPPTEAILYDGRAEQLREYDFAGWNGCFWQRDKQISPRGEGDLHVLGEGVLRIDRRTPEGRYEVTFSESIPRTRGDLGATNIAAFNAAE